MTKLLPRRTVRLRLTLLYSGLFLLSGVALLVILYLLVGDRITVLVNDPNVESRLPVQTCVWPDDSPSPSTSPCSQLARTIADQQRTPSVRRLLLIRSGIALAIMTVVSLALGWLMAGRVLRPLRRITATTRHVSAHNLHERLALTGPDDELKELGDTVDGLLARLEASFAAQRQFVANASHELRTPLARQRTLLEVALDDPDPRVGTLLVTCERVLRAGLQQERLIEALLTLARSERGLEHRDPIDLRAVTAEIVVGGGPGCTVSVRAAVGSAAILGDRRLIERLIANLVDNAVHHNHPDGHVDVTTETVDGRPVLRVANSGPVVPAAEIARLLQPFQRATNRRQANPDGLGLGLPIAVAIAVAHDAELRARPRPGGGLIAEVTFPAVGDRSR
jgi:signal transduction histidine kinase